MFKTQSMNLSTTKFLKYFLSIAGIISILLFTISKINDAKTESVAKSNMTINYYDAGRELTYNNEALKPTPVITNFRITDSEKDRVYFDSPNGSVKNLTIKGFTISGKKVVNIDTKKNYFTVSSPFTFWDNNTIRLKDGDGTIHDFTLEFIKNEIKRPLFKGKEFYVSPKGDNLNDGLAKNTAFKTLSFALTKVSAGDKIWVEAGDYGNEKIEIVKTASKLQPIEIEGYIAEPGDLTSLYLNYENGILDNSQMPYFNGSNSSRGTFFDLTNASYYIIKNLQAENFENGFYSTSSVDNIHLERIILNNIGNGSDHYSGFAMAGVYGGDSDNWKVRDAILINAKAEALSFYGSHNLATNVKVYSDDNSEPYSGTDYYIVLKGSNNIIINSVAHRNGVKHRGHGFGTKSTKIISEYNLIDDCIAKGISLESYFFAHSKSQYNVAKNSISIGEKALTNGGSQHLMVRDGASNNIFENIHCEKGQSGVSIEHTGENSETTFGNNNKWINCSFKDMRWCFGVTDDSSCQDVFTQNEIIHCTFTNTRALWRNAANGDNSNRIINCIIQNSSDSSIGWKKGGKMNWTFEYNNFYNNGWKAPVGIGNIYEDPQLVDVDNNNFEPQNIALLSAPKLSIVNYSASKKERTNITTMGSENHSKEYPH